VKQEMDKRKKKFWCFFKMRERKGKAPEQSFNFTLAKSKCEWSGATWMPGQVEKGFYQLLIDGH